MIKGEHLAIPDYQTIMRPLLEVCRDQREHRVRDLIEVLAAKFNLDADERADLLPSGTATTFGSRVGWAKTYLKQAGLLEQPARAIVRITARGLEALSAKEPIDNSYLARFQEFVAFQTRSRPPQEQPGAISNVPEVTPEEALQQAFNQLRASLINEVHESLLQASPAFFERAVVGLLHAMGYGGAVEDAGILLGGPGDGGVDGAIKEDKLGLDTVYVQAKKGRRIARWAMPKSETLSVRCNCIVRARACSLLLPISAERPALQPRGPNRVWF
jgi:restriction system protein